MNESKPLENLVFEGGGVKGIAYAGAIHSLKKHSLLNKVKRVAGTSAGASTAMLVSMHCTPEEVKDIVQGTKFSSFEDRFNPFRIPFRYGLFKGRKLLNWLKSAIKQKGYDPESTFEDFKNAGCLELRVFACNLNKKDAIEFSYRKTPTVKVAEAVRASMGAPLFFAAWQFPDGNPDNDIYVDGGTVLNYPFTAFDKSSYENTVGFHLDDHEHGNRHNDLKFRKLGHYIKYLFDALLYAQTIVFKHNSRQVAHSVMIDDFGISASDFKLTKKDQHNLYESGISCTDQYIKEHNLVDEFGGAHPDTSS